MERKATTQEQRTKLAALGFVRVDGLKMFRPGRVPRPKNTETLEARPEWRGRCSTKNGTAVIYTAGGEIWLCIRSVADVKAIMGIAAISLELCPQGPGSVFIPGNTGEQFSYREVLQRVANPDW